MFLEQNINFPKRHWVRSRNVFLSSARLDFLVVNKRSCFENFLRSLYLKQYVFFVQMQSRSGCAGCRKLRLIMGFKSCIWDIQYQLFKRRFFIFWKRGLRRFVLCAIVLMIFVQTFLKRWKGWPMPPKPRHKLSKMSLSPSKNIALSCTRLVSLLWEVREIDLREALPVLVVILVVSSVFLFQQRQCPTELEKWPWSVCLKFFGQKDLRKDYF